MPPVELSANTSKNTSDQPTTIIPVLAAFVSPSVKAKTGIIYPPPEVRSNFFLDDFISIIFNLLFKY
jgi:hypothetical protein